MSKTTASLPIARSWRDIPQQVRPRAMSRGGKRRSALRGLQMLGGACALLIAAGATWEVYTVLRASSSRPIVPASEALPIGDNVEPITDGVLDKAWLRQTLALPSGATLAGIDPAALRLRVLAGGQVKAAEIVRHFPQTLAVHLSERMPVARLMVQGGGGLPKEYLVARDGVIYVGHGYDPKMIKTLPWLDGVRPQTGGPGLATIAGMEAVADFLVQCSYIGVQHLYRDWRILSLARLESDGLIEVRTDAGTKIIFSVRDASLYSQLARLDSVLDAMAGSVPAGAIKEINLAIDATQVPVTFGSDGGNAASLLRPGANARAAGHELAAQPNTLGPRARNPLSPPESSSPGFHFHIYP